MIPTILEGILDKQGLGRKNDIEFLQSVEKHVKATAKLLRGGEGSGEEGQGWSERKWLLGGEKLTIADISVFSQFICFAGTPEGLSEMEKYPYLMEWLERVKQATEPEPIVCLLQT
jgi:glutathione S-transferase